MSLSRATRARIGARTGGIARAGAPSRNDVLALLFLLQVMQAQHRDPAPTRLAAPRGLDSAPIGYDRNAVLNYVGQAGTDAVLEGFAGKAIDFLKQNAEAAAVSALGGALGIGEGVAAAGGLAPALTSAASALAAAAPVLTVATDIAAPIIGVIDAFGGDVSIATYATTPQLDATTALGRAAAAKQAALIKQDLVDTQYKFARKSGFLGG